MLRTFRRKVYVGLLVAISTLVVAPVSSKGAEWAVEPLVSSPADELYPMWSPDGQQVAYFSNESGSWQLYIINADGSEKWQVSSGLRPVYAHSGTLTWSSDCRYILYAQLSQPDVHPMDLFKCRLTPSRDSVEEYWNLTQAPHTPATLTWQSPRFSPDGNWIVAERVYNGWPKLYTLTNRDADATESDWINIGQPAMSEYPSWSPDSEWIVYSHASNYTGGNYSDIWIVKPDGSNDTKLVDRSETQEHIAGFAWSHNGEYIAFSYHCGPDSYPSHENRLGLIYADGSTFPGGSKIRWLDVSQSAFINQQYPQIADIWSPDGSSLVYSRRERGVDPDLDIWIVDSAGNKTPVVQSPGDDAYARFSVDGKIAFQTNRNGNWDIYGAILTEPAVEATVDIDPDTLNLNSKGRWITCYIWLPEEYDVADADPDTILLNGEVEAAWSWMDGEEQILMVKFSRSEVQEILDPGEVELTVSGELTDGTQFEGSDTIRVIDKGGKKK